MTLLDKLVNKALQDPYLYELLTKLEYAYANYFIGKDYNIYLPNEKEYLDCLRFIFFVVLSYLSLEIFHIR